jgi:hypothetical protein
MGMDVSPRGEPQGRLARLLAGWMAGMAAQNSDEAEQRGQIVREGELAQNGAESECGVWAVLKRELGCVGKRRGRGSRRACALVHGGPRGRRS